jgi:CRP/FNR family cyclic AMP-dependent transcriptional regulator
MAAPRASALLLRSVPLFGSLSDAQCELLAPAMQRRTHARGTTIIEAGEPTSSLHIVVSGQAQVVMSDRKGNVVILAILKSGEHFGEMGLIDDLPRSASVVARETCEILTLGQADFQHCLREHFEVAMTVTRTLVDRLRNADRRIGNLALLDVYGRVAQLLLQESEEVDGLRMVKSPLSRQDIARMVGASRERVSRVMKDLEQRGFIEPRGRALVLRERALED